MYRCFGCLQISGEKKFPANPLRTLKTALFPVIFSEKTFRIFSLPSRFARAANGPYFCGLKLLSFSHIKNCNGEYRQNHPGYRPRRGRELRG
jgi:hypothetical protein